MSDPVASPAGNEPAAVASPAAAPPVLNRQASFTAIHEVLHRHGHGVLAEHPHIELPHHGETIIAGKGERQHVLAGTESVNPVYESLHKETARLWPEYVKRNPQAGPADFKRLAATVAGEHFPRHQPTHHALAAYGQDQGPFDQEFPGLAKQREAQAIPRDYARVASPKNREEFRNITEWAHVHGDVGQLQESTGGAVSTIHRGIAQAAQEHEELRGASKAVGKILDEAAKMPTQAGYAAKLAEAGKWFQEHDRPEEAKRLLQRAHGMSPELKRQEQDERQRAILSRALGGQPEVIQGKPVPEKPPLSAMGQWAMKAKTAGIAPAALHHLAHELRSNDKAYTEEIGQALARARQRAAAAGINLSTNRGDERLNDKDLPGFDEVVTDFAQQFPHLVKNDDPEQSLIELLAAGNPKGMRVEEAYQQAFEQLQMGKAWERQPGGEPGDVADEPSVGPQKKGDYRGLINPQNVHFPVAGHLAHENLLQSIGGPPIDTSSPEAFTSYIENAIEHHGYSRVETEHDSRTLHIETHHQNLGRIKRWVNANVDPQIFDEVHYTTFGHPDKQPREHRQTLRDQSTPFHRLGAVYFSRDSLDTVDEDLWQQCQNVCRTSKPFKLPFVIGKVDGCDVCLVNGDEIILRPDKPEDDEHPHMDFVEGANDEEAPWVRREFGPDYILIDAVNTAVHNWPFVCYHECHERRLMVLGMDYLDAHPHANSCEKQLRLRSRQHGETPVLYGRGAAAFFERLQARRLLRACART